MQSWTESLAILSWLIDCQREAEKAAPLDHAHQEAWTAETMARNTMRRFLKNAA